MQRAILLVALLAAATAGCIGADDAGVSPASTNTEDETPQVGPDEDVRTLGWTAATRTPVSSYNYLGSGSAVIPFGGLVTGAVFEMRWTPSTPLSEEMMLEVQHGATGETVAEVVGSSPVRVAIADNDTDAAELILRVRPAEEPGVWVDQDYDIHIAVFRDMPFDPDHEFGS